MVQELYGYLSDNLYIILTIVLLLDSIPGIGVIIPDEIVMALVGFVLNELGYPPIVAILLAGTSLVLGQSFMYWLGLKYSKATLNFAKTSPEILKRVELYMEKNDLLVNISLRLTSTIRSIYAIVCGVRKYPFGRFLKFEIPISFFKAALYIEIGYLIANNLTDVESLTSRLSVMTGIIVAISVFVSFLTSREIFAKD